MLLLAFQIGEDRYALDTARILRVLQVPRLKQVPHAPRGVVGLLQVSETCVPVVDLSAAALGRPSRKSVSTRLILTNDGAGSDIVRMLGIIVEKATGTLKVKAETFMNAGVSIPQASYLGPVLSDANGLIQMIEVDRLLPEEIRAALLR
jgi:chemotaxis-related protein WspB